MTCPYGASVKAGVGSTDQIAIDRGVWEVVSGLPASWFDWLLAIFIPYHIEAATLCALNPSDPVLPSVATIVAAFFKDPGSILQLYNYIRDKLTYSVFSQNCVCNPAGSTCTAGWANTFVPAAVGPGGSQFEIGTKFTSLVSGATFGGWRVWTPQAYNYAVGLTLWDSTGAVVTSTTISAGIPAGYSTYPISPIVLATGSYMTSMCVQAGYQWCEDAAAPANDSVATWVSHLYHSGCGAIPATASGGWEGVQPILCASIVSTPTAPVVPTQPTDFAVPPGWTCTTIGDVCLRLQQIDEKLDWLIRTEPLVQNSSVSEGIVHAGLTGTGTLVVSGILGVRVLLTTIPSQYGGITGSPPLHFGLGRIDWMTPEGWLGRRYLGDTPLEQIFPNPLVRSVGYSLSGGVVATITELIKGP